MKRKHSVFLSFFAIFVLVQFTGCSVIGVIAGSSMDKNAKKQLSGNDAKIMELKPGTELEVGLINKTQTKGTLTSITPLPESRYSEMLQQFSLRHPEAEALPPFNKSIKVNALGLKDSSYCFLGFEGKNWIFRAVETEKIAKIHASSVTSIIDKDGNPLPVEMVKRLADLGKLPHRQSLILMADRGSLTIPLDDITFIKRKKKSKKALTFGLIGLAIDVAAIAASGIFMKKWVEGIFSGNTFPNISQ
jgi:hypothetical protein